MPASIRMRRSAALTLLVPTMLLSLVLADVSPSLPRPPRSPARQMISKALSPLRQERAPARYQIGDPYGYGAAGPDAFDCSGLRLLQLPQGGLPASRGPRLAGAFRAPHQPGQPAPGRLRVLPQQRRRLPRGDLRGPQGRPLRDPALPAQWRACEVRSPVDQLLVRGHPAGLGTTPRRLTWRRRASPIRGAAPSHFSNNTELVDDRSYLCAAFA